MTQLSATGDNPGWIFKHSASLTSEGRIIISGGECVVVEDQEQEFISVTRRYTLDLATLTWRSE